MNNIYDIYGRPVSEEEAAKDLGFVNIHEFRRWQTSEGQRFWELANRLRVVEGERDRFLWTGKRMQAVLRRIEPVLVELISGADPATMDLRKLLLGLQVADGRGVDWDHVLEDWWEKPSP